MTMGKKARSNRSREERYYVTEEESAMIERAAESSGVSKSDYARKLVIEQARMDVAAIDAGEVPGKVVRPSSLADQLHAVASQLALVAESARRLSRTGNW